MPRAFVAVSPRWLRHQPAGRSRPLARAGTYQRLGDAGRTIKGIAAALGGSADAKAQRRLERRVRDALRILEHPEAIQHQVA